MPDQSGAMVIQAARECDFNQPAPLIVCTAHADQQLEQESLALGADQVLIKPVLPKNFNRQ